jgi:hypothetical protein
MEKMMIELLTQEVELISGGLAIIGDRYPDGIIVIDGYPYDRHGNVLY